MRKILLTATVLAIILSISGCAKYDYEKASEKDLAHGEVISSVNTHDGFHGDGYSITVIKYEDSSFGDTLAESENWHRLPLSENLKTFVYQPYDADFTLPKIENGYYYFYDRHSEAKDPKNDADLLNRASFNFDLSLYDADTDTMFVCEYDT